MDFKGTIVWLQLGRELKVLINKLEATWRKAAELLSNR